MSKCHTVVPVSIIGESTTTKCMICLEDHKLKDVIKHSRCSAVICKECIKRMPDELLQKCVYCRRYTLEFYNKKYENNNINININTFGEMTPPIQININNRIDRSSNRRRMSIRSLSIDDLFQEKNCWDYIIDFLMCVCRLRTIHYIFMFILVNALVMVCGLIVLTVFTHEMNDDVKLWIIYLTGLSTIAILYLCFGCCSWLSSERQRVSNQRIFD